MVKENSFKRLKYKYQLLFNPQSIKMPKELSEKEQRKYRRKLYMEKAKMHENLGALPFREVVLKAEKIKYKVLKKICPNYIKYYDKWCNFKTRRKLKKANSPKEADLIDIDNRMSKLSIRKEYLTEQNRNYHMNENYPTQILEYLNWNKEVHQKGLLKDIIIIPILSIATAFSVPLALPFLIIELGSAFINLQCINLQEHSIAEYESCKPILQKQAEKERKKRNTEYTDGKKLIGNLTLNQQNIPTIEEIIKNIKTPQQAAQIRDWAKSIQQKQNRNDVKTMRK